MHYGNAGNFDQCNLQEAAEMIENIDDNNAPAPENIFTDAPTDIIFQGWGHSGQCKSKKDDVNNVQPQVNISRVGEEMLTVFKIFELLFFKKFVEDMIIPVTYEAMENGGDVLTYSEYLVFLGIWLLMAMIMCPAGRSDSCPF